MPRVFNGVGTWYYGKTNVHSHQGKCPHCGAQTTLTSFDTTLFAVLFFVPLFPLKQARVFHMCAKCQRHTAMKLAQWNELRDEKVGQALVDFEASPRDPVKAKKAIGAAMAFEDDNAFLAIAEGVDREFRQDALVQADLAEGYWFFGRSVESVEVTRRVFDLNPDEAQRRLLGGRLVLIGQPDEGEKVLRPLLDDFRPADYGLAKLIAMGFQSKGQHERALEVLNAWAAKDPELANDKESKQLRAISQKHLASGKPIASKELETGTTRTAAGSVTLSKALPWIGPSLLSLGVFSYVLACLVAGQAYRIFVVGGLPQAYDVKINGVTVKASPHTALPFRVVMGEVTIEVPDPKLRIAPVTLHIEVPFWSRPGSHAVYVVNPDSAAVILVSHLIYSAQASAPSDAPETRVGKNLHEFADIDFPFETPPASISTQSKGKILRTGLELYGTSDVKQITAALANANANAAQARDFIKARVAHEPKTNPETLSLAFTYLPGDEFQKLIEPRLTDRPVDVEIHRAYQSSVEATTPDHDLVADYQKLLEKDPESPDLTYLLARVTRDDEASAALMTKSLSSKTPSAFAANSLAYRAMARGEFGEAYTLLHRALAIDSANEMTLLLQPDILLANKKYDELIDADKKQNGGQFSLTTVRHKALVLAVRGQTAAAFKEIDDAAGDVKALAGNEIALAVVSALKQGAIYQSGDMAAYARFIDTLEKTPTSDFYRAAIKGDVDALDRASQGNETSMRNPELVTLLALRAGKQEVASRQLATIIKALNHQTHDPQHAARMLTAEEPPAASDALKLVLEPRDKCFLLTALAIRHPSLRAELVPLAQKLNFDPSFPHQELKNILGGLAATGDENSP